MRRRDLTIFHLRTWWREASYPSPRFPFVGTYTCAMCGSTHWSSVWTRRWIFIDWEDDQILSSPVMLCDGCRNKAVHDDLVTRVLGAPYKPVWDIPSF